MLDHVPTVRARYLGQELHRIVQQTGRTATEMAALLSWSPSKLSRLLSGKRVVSQVDIATLLGLCGVVGRRRDEVLELAADVYAPTWWRDYGRSLPVHNATLADNEANAHSITTFHNTLVPDLLQTSAYTRALLRALPSIPAGELDGRIAETQRRQQVLDLKYPPTLHVFLDEYAMTRTGAGDEIMSEQAHHLLRMAVRPNVVLRVVPEPVGIRDATSFTLLDFAALPTVAYLEQPTSTAFLEADDTIATYRQVLAELDGRALDDVGSRTWLAEVGRQRG